jgi:hypothetical protein
LLKFFTCTHLEVLFVRILKKLSNPTRIKYVLDFFIISHSTCAGWTIYPVLYWYIWCNLHTWYHYRYGFKKTYYLGMIDDNTNLMFKSWYKSHIVFNLYFVFTHLIFLFYGNPISFQNIMICPCCFFLLTFVHIKINLIQWVYFYFSLWPITCHVQNYYDILQFWGFSPKQKAICVFQNKKMVA